MPTVTALKAMFQAQIAPGDPAEFLRILTEADMRLLEFGRWRWTRRSDTLVPVNGIVTLPTTYASILGARVDKAAVEIRDEDYEFVPGGRGEVEVGSGNCRLIDQGMVDMPDPTSFAQVTINPDGNHNSITYTAKEAGPAGAEISIIYAEPEDRGALEVTVEGKTITITPGSRGQVIVTGDLTSDGTTPVEFPPLHAGLEGEWLHDNGELSPEYKLLTRSSYFELEAQGKKWWSADFPATPDLVSLWLPQGSNTGTPEISYDVTAASRVIHLVNFELSESSDLVTATAHGDHVTGAIAPVEETFLVGGATMSRRQYKVAGYLADDDVVTALMHFAPVTLMDPDIADSGVPDDATIHTRCPDATALKLMMLGITMEEAHDHGGARSFIADALRSLDNKEQTQRGNATRTINSRPMGMGIRRVRGWR